MTSQVEEMPSTAGRDVEDGVGRWNVYDIANRRRALLFLGLAIGWGASIAYWRLAPAQYESVSQILVMRKDSQLPTSRRGEGNPNETTVDEDMLATHMQLVQSNRIVSEALKKRRLDQLPSVQEALGSDQTPVQYVIENLRVTRGGSGQARGAHVLNIAFRHTTADDAQYILDAVTERYQEFLTQKYQDVNKEAANLIARAREDLEDELKESENKYLELRKSAPLLWDGEQSTNIPRDRYEQVQTELSDLQLKKSETMSRLEVVEQFVAEDAVEERGFFEYLALIDEKNVERLGMFALLRSGTGQSATFLAMQPERTAGVQAEYQGLLKLRAKEKTLARDFGPSHPEVINTREQIETIEAFLASRDEDTTDFESELDFLLEPEKIAQAYLKLLNNDLTAYESREKQLLILAETAENEARDLVVFEMEDETLRGQIDRKTELYSAVVERLRDINLAGDYGGFVNEVIELPELGEEVWPKLSICLALGTILGLVLGGAGAFVAELRDQSFGSPEEVTETLGVKLLAQVPSLEPEEGDTRIAPGADHVDRMLCVLHRPKSRESEVFRKLRTSLFFTAGAQKLRVIQCTSSCQGDGKSTTVANLAASIAQAGRRVLLVDGDLRRPRANVVFGLDNSVGLTDVLIDGIDPWDVAQPTPMPNLTVIPTGPIPANPAELLESPAFAQFVDVAREKYDLVLIDSPPVLAVSDPCITAPHADGTVLVVRVSQNSRPQAIEAKATLEGVGANVVGVVINAWDASETFTSSGSGYGYYRRHEGNDKYYVSDDESVGVRPELASKGSARDNGADH